MKPRAPQWFDGVLVITIAMALVIAVCVYYVARNMGAANIEAPW